MWPLGKSTTRWKINSIVSSLRIVQIERIVVDSFNIINLHSSETTNWCITRVWIVKNSSTVMETVIRHGNWITSVVNISLIKTFRICRLIVIRNSLSRILIYSDNILLNMVKNWSSIRSSCCGIRNLQNLRRNCVNKIEVCIISKTMLCSGCQKNFGISSKYNVISRTHASMILASVMQSISSWFTWGYENSGICTSCSRCSEWIYERAMDGARSSISISKLNWVSSIWWMRLIKDINWVSD